MAPERPSLRELPDEQPKQCCPEKLGMRRASDLEILQTINKKIAGEPVVSILPGIHLDGEAGESSQRVGDGAMAWVGDCGAMGLTNAEVRSKIAVAMGKFEHAHNTWGPFGPTWYSTDNRVFSEKQKENFRKYHVTQIYHNNDDIGVRFDREQTIPADPATAAKTGAQSVNIGTEVTCTVDHSDPNHPKFTNIKGVTLRMRDGRTVQVDEADVVEDGKGGLAMRIHSGGTTFDIPIPTDDHPAPNPSSPPVADRSHESLGRRVMEFFIGILLHAGASWVKRKVSGAVHKVEHKVRDWLHRKASGR